MEVVERLAASVWRCVEHHSKKGHKLRLVVCDDGSVLECVFCGIPAAIGSDDVIQALGRRMKDVGIEFDFECYTEECIQ